jgi:hypothetical protein
VDQRRCVKAESRSDRGKKSVNAEVEPVDRDEQYDAQHQGYLHPVSLRLRNLVIIYSRSWRITWNSCSFFRKRTTETTARPSLSPGTALIAREVGLWETALSTTSFREAFASAIAALCKGSGQIIAFYYWRDPLRAFETAARTLSFTAAASELGQTQGAVSHQVSTLEARLGVKLFERQSRGLKLTDAGGKYLPLVRDSLERLRAAEDLVRLERPSVLTVTMSPNFASK